MLRIGRGLLYSWHRRALAGLQKPPRLTGTINDLLCSAKATVATRHQDGNVGPLRPLDGMYIRQATADDRNAVLDISHDIYDGVDFLSDFFDEVFINCDKTTAYVVIHCREIIGFISDTVVDNGDTMIMRAGRLKPAYNDQGVYKTMLDHLQKMCSAKTHIAYSGVHQLDCFQFKLAQQTVRYDVPPNSIQLTKEHNSESSALSPLTQGHLHDFFTTQEYREYLFPGDRLMVLWVPYRPVQANIPLIWMRDGHSFRLSDVKMESDSGVKGLVTIGTEFIGPTGLYVYNIDIFGQDPISMKEHIVSHLNIFGKRAKDKAALNVCFDSNFARSTLERDLYDLGLKTKAYQSRLCVYEMQIQ